MRTFDIKLLGAAFVAVVSVFTLSCDGDDANENPDVTVSKRIKQVVTEEWNSKNEKTDEFVVQFSSLGGWLFWQETEKSVSRI